MDQSSGMGLGFTIVWLVVLFGIMYFLVVPYETTEKGAEENPGYAQ